MPMFCDMECRALAQDDHKKGKRGRWKWRLTATGCGKVGMRIGAYRTEGKQLSSPEHTKHTVTLCSGKSHRAGQALGDIMVQEFSITPLPP